jgi:hypothetical protein
MVIKIFNNLPPYIKETSTNIRKFEVQLKHFLHTHYFYTLEEYFQYSTGADKKWLSLRLSPIVYFCYFIYICFVTRSLYIIIDLVLAYFKNILFKYMSLCYLYLSLYSFLYFEIFLCNCDCHLVWMCSTY